MATWSDVVAYMKQNYRVADEEPNMLKLIFETGNLRSQLVFVWHIALNDGQEEWAQIESPIGELGGVDLAAALQKVSSTVCGGLSLVQNLVTFRHSVPLLNLNINELEWPLGMVVKTADELEKALVGGDRY